MYFHQNFQLIFQKSPFMDIKDGDNLPSPLCASMYSSIYARSDRPSEGGIWRIIEFATSAENSKVLNNFKILKDE